MTSAIWAFRYFGLSCFEQIIFHLKVPLEGTNTEFIWDWVRQCMFGAVILCGLEILCIYALQVLLFSFAWCAFLVICVNMMFAFYYVGAFGFIINQMRTTSFYEQYYVDPKNVRLHFPQKSKNLIHIFVESLETTYTSKKRGGNYHDDLLSPLTGLDSYVNFSHGDKLGGFDVVSGTGWTTAGIAAQSAGIPLFASLKQKMFCEDVAFYPGAYGIGDILEKQGYQQMYMIGSNAAFGGREYYFRQHGSFSIFDLNTAYEKGKLKQDFKEFWGYDDHKLFQYAKEELLKLSQDKKPFHFVMLTVDTHHPYGFVCGDCKQTYDEQLSNVIACNIKQLRTFVDWLQKQAFYKDSIVVISGDHLSMAQEYIDRTYDKKYHRSVFNMFLNTKLSKQYTKHRKFTSFDMYPTILSAMGIKIDGNALGLGVNLNSSQKTLIERVGYTYMDKELRKHSMYYQRHIAS